MSWAGKDRQQIEQELLAAVDLARARYEKKKAEHIRLSNLAADVGLESRDGSLAQNQAHKVSVQRIRALAYYEQALHRFSEFIISGKLPPEDAE